MQEEAARKKQLLLMVSPLLLRAKLQPPHIGGSVKGNRNNIVCHYLARAEMLEDGYFMDGATHGLKKIVAAFGCTKKHFGRLCIFVRGYDSYFL
jgi:hypothetical protein